MKRVIFTVIIIGLFILAPGLAFSNNLPDKDKDGVPDKDEINIYYTDPDNPDTDGDGYNDWIELNNGYSPYSGGRAKLKHNDFDYDGLSDDLELRFGTNPTLSDTDRDTYVDGQEVENGYDPAKPDGAKLEKRIEIDTKNQLLGYFLGDVRLGLFPVSSGIPSMPTPSGQFKILVKNDRQWSRMAGLWMPYWLMFDARGYGIHELPEWPNGTKEGKENLGKPASHGCVRLGVEPAKKLYDWAEIGTSVYIN